MMSLNLVKILNIKGHIHNDPILKSVAKLKLKLLYTLVCIVYKKFIFLYISYIFLFSRRELIH